MNSIINLRSDDFELQENKGSYTLSCSIKGLSLVLFWSPMCNICKELLPSFNRLPQVINGVLFCTLNINNNQQIIQMSQKTIAPIEYVPYIVFYVNGTPLLRYDDEISLERIIQFCQYSMKLVENKKMFIDKGAKVDSGGAVPKYSLGIPYMDFKCNESGFCYLSEKQAYGGVKQGQNK